MSTQALNSWSRSSTDIPIKQVSQNIWEVPQDYLPGMKVPARIYADEDLLAKMRTDRTIQQCVNVTHLTGIYKYAITMPDGHEGYGFPIGEEGCMEAADPSKVSSSARSRGAPQLGSLGSGNHFIEIERADRIFDERVAQRLGIHKKGQILVLIHTGSRGYGHQICSDYLKVMERATGKYNIHLPDRELAACPSKSPEAEDYLPAMSAACNFAWVNRQMITHWARQAFEKVFAKSADLMDMRIVYDVCHNVAKIESHQIDGEATKVIVHRKGATRSFPPGHPDVPAQYRDVGQPVLIPGSMGTSSWVLIGTPKAMELSFGTTAHGAGRFMSRSAAKRKWRGEDLQR